MQGAASISLLLMSLCTQPSLGQQTPTSPATQTNPTAPAAPQPVVNDTTGQAGLPQAPAPKLTEPLFMRPTSRDFTKPKSHIWNPIKPYTPMNVPEENLGNTPKIDQLLRDGKIYLR